MVLHVFQAAVVGQAVKKISDGLFRLHESTSPAWNLDTVYGCPVESDSPGLQTQGMEIALVGLDASRKLRTGLARTVRFLHGP